MSRIIWRKRKEPHEAFLVTGTRLTLRSFRTMPRFVWLSIRVILQARTLPGLVAYSFRAAPFRKTFWTVTVWEDTGAVGRFLALSSHRAAVAAMPELNVAEAAIKSWRGETSSFPCSWDEVDARLADPDLVSHDTRRVA